MLSMWFKNETNLVVVIPDKLRGREVVPRMEASPQQKPLKRAHAMFLKALIGVKGDEKKSMWSTASSKLVSVG